MPGLGQSVNALGSSQIHPGYIHCNLNPYLRRNPDPLAATIVETGVKVSYRLFLSLAQDPRKEHFKNPNPHRIWIIFLEEQFAVLKYAPKELLNVLIKMLQMAVANTEGFRSTS